MSDQQDLELLREWCASRPRDSERLLARKAHVWRVVAALSESREAWKKYALHLELYGDPSVPADDWAREAKQLKVAAEGDSR